MSEFSIFPNMEREREERQKQKELQKQKEAEKKEKAKAEARRQLKLKRLADLYDNNDPVPGKGAGSNKKAGLSEPPALSRGLGHSPNAERLKEQPTAFDLGEFKLRRS